MNFITAWSAAIIGAVTLATFVDTLMPEADLKKYVNLVLGFIIMIILIKPIGEIKNMDIINGGFAFDIAALENSPDYDHLDTLQREQIESTFKNRIENSLSSRLSEYSPTDITVEVNADLSDTDYGKIQKVQIRGIKPKDSATVQKIITSEYGSPEEINID